MILHQTAILHLHTYKSSVLNSTHDINIIAMVLQLGGNPPHTHALKSLPPPPLPSKISYRKHLHLLNAAAQSALRAPLHAQQSNKNERRAPCVWDALDMSPRDSQSRQKERQGNRYHMGERCFEDCIQILASLVAMKVGIGTRGGSKRTEVARFIVIFAFFFLCLCVFGGRCS